MSKSTIYFDMDVPLIVTEHKAWLAANYKKGSAFTINGTGKQQYMCSIDNQQASYLLKKTLKLQKSEAVKDIIKSALVDINNKCVISKNYYLQVSFLYCHI